MTSQALFHGTTALNAACIASQGFRLLEEGARIWGRGYLGDGIYVSQLAATAIEFADSATCNLEHARPYLLSVELNGGTRILRLGQQPEPGILRSLRAEFGKDILSPRFPQAIPRNKHLRKRELIALLNELWSKDAIDPSAPGQPNSGIRSYLRKLGFHGFGHPDSDIGIVIFNPSALRLRAIQSIDTGGSLHPADLERLKAQAETELQGRQLNVDEWCADPEFPARERSSARAELVRCRRALSALRNIP